MNCKSIVAILLAVCMVASLARAGGSHYGGKPVSNTQAATACCSGSKQIGLANVDALDCSNVLSNDNLNLASAIFPGGKYVGNTQAAQVCCDKSKQVGLLNLDVGDCSNIASNDNLNALSLIGL